MTVATARARRDVDRVSNERLRQEFIRRRDLGWVTAELVAVRVGWTKPKRGMPRGDSSRVERVLGLRSWGNGHGGTYVQRTARLDDALAIAGALGLDPVEVDL